MMSFANIIFSKQNAISYNQASAWNPVLLSFNKMKEFENNINNKFVLSLNSVSVTRHNISSSSSSNSNGVFLFFDICKLL